MMRSIDSPQNPMIKSVAKLRTRRGRQSQSQIIIDGQREIERATAAGVRIQQLFLPMEERAPELVAWIAQQVAAGGEVFELSERAFAKIGFGNRHEPVAVAAYPARTINQLKLGPAPTIAVLAELEKPGNIGAILRSADGAGLDAVIVVDGATDLFNPNTIRASLGTVFTQQVAEATFDELVAWCQPRDLVHYQARLADDTVDFADVDYRRACSIVLGAEAHGLSDRWNQLSPSQSISISMSGVADSLNVSVAAGVIFYESQRENGVKRTPSSS